MRGSWLTLVGVSGVGELVQERGNLQSLEEDPLLALDLNVPGPPEEPGEVDLGLNGTSESVVLGSSLEEVGELVSLLLGGLAVVSLSSSVHC